MAETEIDFRTDYPNLIIFLGPNKNERLFKQLKKSFNEFKYGPIYLQQSEKHESGGRPVCICRIMEQNMSQHERCLAEGEGMLPCDAEEQAVGKLLNKLKDSCYVIEANPEYFRKKTVPSFALNADPAQRHVYKVVFLKNNSQRRPFPHPVSGAVDYVEDYKELLEYIEAHAKSNSKADLFILNVLKSDRQRVREVCQKNLFNMEHLIGCSDMGIYAYHSVPTRGVLQELLTVGGQTIKYKLIGPRDRFGNGSIKDEDGVDKKEDLIEKGQEQEEEIVITPWIADHLILLERVSEKNEPESSREIIFCSVRSCPDTEEFIIEKKTKKTSMMIAEAMIDKKVVGRARGFSDKQVKKQAAEDAMKNLKECCYYIVAKKSYYGSSYIIPTFLAVPNPTRVTRLYRIAENTETRYDKILKQFAFSPQEDIYFLENFSMQERNRIYNLAKEMHFLVRWIGLPQFLCVYKNRKPKDIFMELMTTNGKENEKYKLIVPPTKMHQHAGGKPIQNWNDQRTAQLTQPNIQPRAAQNWSDQGTSQLTQPNIQPKSDQNWNNQGTSHQTQPNIQPRAAQNWNDQGSSHHTQPNIQPRSAQNLNDRRTSHETQPNIQPRTVQVWNDQRSSPQTQPYIQPKAAQNWNDQRTSHETQPNIQPRVAQNWNDQGTFNQTPNIHSRAAQNWNDQGISHQIQFNVQSRASQIWNDQGTSHQAQPDIQPRAAQNWNDQGTTHQNQPNIQPRASQTWNDQGTSHQTQPDIQPRVAQNWNDHRTSLQTPNIHHSAAQNWNNSNRSQHQAPYVDSANISQSCRPGAENSAQEKNETPSWVMKFIQSAPEKHVNTYANKKNHFNKNHINKSPHPVSCPTEFIEKREKDDVYKRYKFNVPKSNQPPLSTSSVGDETKNNITSKGFNSQTKEWNNASMDGSRGDKRPFYEEHDFKEEREYTNKFPKLTTNSFQERTGIKVEEEYFKDTSKLFDMGSESTQNQHNSPLVRGMKEHYDQGSAPNTSTGEHRNFANLFDGVESQGPPRLPFHQQPWKQRPFKKKGGKKNTSFRKMERYGGKPPRR